MDIGIYISIPMTVNFFCQTFHFFLQYALLARYSNSKKQKNKKTQVLFFSISDYSNCYSFHSSLFFFNWLYVTNSWISLKLLIWDTFAFSSHSKCKFLFALCMAASGDWGEGMRGRRAYPLGSGAWELTWCGACLSGTTPTWQ